MHNAGIRLPLLLQPISLRGIFARNRIVVSPMCQYRSVSGGPTDWHLVSLGKYAIAAQVSCLPKRRRWKNVAAKPMNVRGYIRTAMALPIAGSPILFVAKAQFRQFNWAMPVERHPATYRGRISSRWMKAMRRVASSHGPEYPPAAFQLRVRAHQHQSRCRRPISGT